jgi:hypothetical protein
MTDNLIHKRGLEAAFQPLMDALNKPVRFEFQSIAMTEDDTHWQALFEGDDGHTYAVTLPVRHPRVATLCRVD